MKILDLVDTDFSIMQQESYVEVEDVVGGASPDVTTIVTNLEKFGPNTLAETTGFVKSLL